MYFLETKEIDKTPSGGRPTDTLLNGTEQKTKFIVKLNFKWYFNLDTMVIILQTEVISWRSLI